MPPSHRPLPAELAVLGTTAQGFGTPVPWLYAEGCYRGGAAIFTLPLPTAFQLANMERLPKIWRHGTPVLFAPAQLCAAGCHREASPPGRPPPASARLDAGESWRSPCTTRSSKPQWCKCRTLRHPSTTKLSPDTPSSHTTSTELANPVVCPSRTTRSSQPSDWVGKNWKLLCWVPAGRVSNEPGPTGISLLRKTRPLAAPTQETPHHWASTGHPRTQCLPATATSGSTPS